MQHQNSNSGIQLTFNSLAEEKIKELQAIIDGITEPLILIDPNFDIKRANQATLGFTNEEGEQRLCAAKVAAENHVRRPPGPKCAGAGRSRRDGSLQI